MRISRLLAFAAAVGLAGPVFGGTVGTAKPPAIPFEIDVAYKALGDCQRGAFDFRALTKLRREKPKDAMIQSTIEYFVAGAQAAGSYFQHYLACTALAKATPRTCDDAKGFNNNDVDAPGCPEVYESAMMANEVLRKKKGGESICRKIVDVFYDGKPPSKAAVDAACREYADALRTGKTQALCAQVKDAFPKNQPTDCPGVFAFMAGKSEGCNAIKDGASRDSCLYLANLVAGLRSVNASACEASPYCGSLLRGKTSSCDPILAKANKGFCGYITTRRKVIEDAWAGRTAENEVLAEKRKLREDIEKTGEQKAAGMRALAEKEKIAEMERAKALAEKQQRRQQSILEIKKRIHEENEGRQYQKGQRMTGHPEDVLKARGMGHGPRLRPVLDKKKKPVEKKAPVEESE